MANLVNCHVCGNRMRAYESAALAALVCYDCGDMIGAESCDYDGNPDPERFRTLLDYYVSQPPAPPLDIFGKPMNSA